MSEVCHGHGNFQDDFLRTFIITLFHSISPAHDSRKEHKTNGLGPYTWSRNANSTNQETTVLFVLIGARLEVSLVRIPMLPFLWSLLHRDNLILSVRRNQSQHRMFGRELKLASFHGCLDI